MSAPVSPDVVIAIPVRNESERIVACLRALDGQTGVAPGRLGLVLFLNNCTDDTEALVEALRPGLSLPLRVITETYAGAHAGWARRKAMDAAAAWIESGVARALSAEVDTGSAKESAAKQGASAVADRGTLLTTDADSRVPADWVARNLAALDAGADAVAGRVVLAPEEAALLPPSLPARGRLEDAYDALITEIETCLDPDPHDPWPCHRTTIGASLGVRLAAYRSVGGMPEIPLGEDGAFVAALLQQGFRVRHPRDVVVTISARLTGRAPGGVADTIRARCEEPDALCDARMERVPRLMLRCLVRRHLRRLHAAGGLAKGRAWAQVLAIPAEEARRIAALPRAAQAVAAAERASPRLAFHPVGPRHLEGQMRLARIVLAALRPASQVRRGRATAAMPLPADASGT